MDDRAVLVEDQQTGYGTLGDEGADPPKRSLLTPIYDKMLPIIVWFQITLGLPGPTDKPTQESGDRAFNHIVKFGLHGHLI